MDKSLFARVLKVVIRCVEEGSALLHNFKMEGDCRNTLITIEFHGHPHDCKKASKRMTAYRTNATDDPRRENCLHEVVSGAKGFPFYEKEPEDECGSGSGREQQESGDSASFGETGTLHRDSLTLWQEGDTHVKTIVDINSQTSASDSRLLNNDNEKVARGRSVSAESLALPEMPWVATGEGSEKSSTSGAPSPSPSWPPPPDDCLHEYQDVKDTMSDQPQAAADDTSAVTDVVPSPSFGESDIRIGTRHLIKQQSLSSLPTLPEIAECSESDSELVKSNTSPNLLEVQAEVHDLMPNLIQNPETLSDQMSFPSDSSKLCECSSVESDLMFEPISMIGGPQTSSTEHEEYSSGSRQSMSSASVDMALGVSAVTPTELGPDPGDSGHGTDPNTRRKHKRDFRDLFRRGLRRTSSEPGSKAAPKKTGKVSMNGSAKQQSQQQGKEEQSMEPAQLPSSYPYYYRSKSKPGTSRADDIAEIMDDTGPSATLSDSGGEGAEGESESEEDMETISDVRKAKEARARKSGRRKGLKL